MHQSNDPPPPPLQPPGHSGDLTPLNWQLKISLTPGTGLTPGQYQIPHYVSGVSGAVYHLTTKTGIFGWKFKWFRPFHWNVSRKYGNAQMYSSFPIPTEMTGKFRTICQNHDRPAGPVHFRALFSCNSRLRLRHGDALFVTLCEAIFFTTTEYLNHKCRGK